MESLQSNGLGTTAYLIVRIRTYIRQSTHGREIIDERDLSSFVRQSKLYGWKIIFGRTVLGVPCRYYQSSGGSASIC